MKLKLKQLSIWLFIFVAFAPIAISYVARYPTKTLFVIYYGDKQHQINFSTWQTAGNTADEKETPSSAPMLRVSTGMNLIVIFDPHASNEAGKVVLKLFQFDGKWIRTIQRPLKQLSGFALGQQHIFLWDGNRIETLNFSGEAQESLSQHLNNSLQQARNNGIKAFDLLSADIQDSLYFFANNGRDIVTLELKSNGEYVTHDINGPIMFSSAKRYDISPANNNDPRVTQTIHSLDGTILRAQDAPRFDKRKVKMYLLDGALGGEFEIPSKSVSQIEQELTFADALDRLSDGGLLFVPTETLMIRYEERGRHVFRKSYPILLYNQSGKFMGTLTTLVVPDCYSPHKELDYLWDIDRAGNLYYLDFQADHLRVMKVPAR